MSGVSRRDFLWATGAGLAGVAATSTWTSATQALAAPQTKPLKVLLISGTPLYDSHRSLDGYEDYLQEQFPIQTMRAFAPDKRRLPGWEQLADCDAVLVFARRLEIEGEPLAAIQEYCRQGRPLVGVRTASHAFQNWLEFDKEILGGNYRGHYDEGPECRIHVVAENAGHPVLAGFATYASEGSLYGNTGVADDATVLLEGSIPGHSEPIAWTRKQNGGRVFYTSLGHPDDFAQPAFRRLLANGLLWTAGRESIAPADA